MTLLKFRRALSVIAACIIAWCLYVISQEGSSVGIWLTIASQGLLIVAMNVDNWIKRKKTPPVA